VKWRMLNVGGWPKKALPNVRVTVDADPSPRFRRGVQEWGFLRGKKVGGRPSEETKTLGPDIGTSSCILKKKSKRETKETSREGEDVL